MSTKKTNARTASKPVEIASAKPPAQPKRELTEFQQYICGLAGDIIVNGANENDLRNLLFGIGAHDYRRKLPDALVPRFWSSEVQKQHVDQAMWDSFKKWKPKLMRLWPEKPEPKDAPLPTTVTEAARANARNCLASAFEDFLAEGRPEDIALMREVLSHWGSENGPFSEPTWGTCQLAESFAYGIDRRVTYIRVPDEHKETVLKYVNMLLDATCEDERAH